MMGEKPRYGLSRYGQEGLLVRVVQYNADGSDTITSNMP